MTHRIALLPGDGIGPEVVAAARCVLDAVTERFGPSFEFDNGLIGGVAIDATGSALPDPTVELCRSADAVLLGAVGGPAWDNPAAAVRPEQGLLGLRKLLGVFANLRPVAPYSALTHASPLRPEIVADVNLVVVRELTGGIYFGAKSREADAHGEVARDVCSYTTPEIERVVRVAGEVARTRRGHVTSVDKANVLETSRLWRQTVSRVMQSEFSDVRLEHMLVDTCAMRLMQRPRDFDVIVTENMFGDILTDEAAVLAGSIGVLPSASLGAANDGKRRPGLYEPIHGSAPDIAGSGKANPIGMILSAAMLLRHSLGLHDEALAVEEAVQATIADGVLTPDLVGPGVAVATTNDVTARVVEHLLAGALSKS
jgi:3-isopropylmalate dehydrogenase